jgi:hypothetical protein
VFRSVIVDVEAFAGKNDRVGGLIALIAPQDAGAIS